ncbi:DNA-processing protein DprA [Euzebya pacifica]|nr:DNA-processing protein DprA [Euzebya pacifica]
MNGHTSQVDRGPGDTDPDGPRSGRGLWRLLAIPGVGPAKARRVAERFGTFAELADAAPEALARIGVAGAAEALAHPPEIELPNVVDAQVITIFDPDYPRALAATSAPPVLVWVWGRLPTEEGLAIVGTRSPTVYGTRVAARAAGEAALEGIPVISGMAAGIDRAAEEAAVDADGRVVSVIPQGLNTLPPVRRRHLDAILAADGAVITEQPPDTNWTGRAAMARNRIIVGLAHTVLIAQATPRSGTAGSIRVALAEQRHLLAPRPDPATVHAREPASELLMAITDPAGCPPDLLGLTGRHAAQAADRRPLVDTVIVRGEELAAAIRPR